MYPLTEPSILQIGVAKGICVDGVLGELGRRDVCAVTPNDSDAVEPPGEVAVGGVILCCPYTDAIPAVRRIGRRGSSSESEGGCHS